MAYRHGYKRSEYREAERGAKLLDAEFPDWWERVDPEKLSSEPVLSQVAGLDYPHGYEAWVPAKLLGTDEWAERMHELVYHGLIAGDDATKARLDIARRTQIERRRGAA